MEVSSFSRGIGTFSLCRPALAAGILSLLTSLLPAQLRPDLVVRSCSLSTNNVLPGQSIGVTADVCNQGQWGTATNWGDLIYLNTAAALNGRETQIGGPYCKHFPQYLLSGQCYSTFSAVVTETVTIPANLAPGTYYIGYRTNYTNSMASPPCTPGSWFIAESNHNNNTCWMQITVQQPSSPPCTFQSVASGCANITLTGADQVIGQLHTITLTAVGFTPGETLVWFAGTPQQSPLPGTSCLLLVAPVASFASVTSSFTDSWKFSAIVPAGGVSAAFQAIRVKSVAPLVLDPSNGVYMTCQ